MQSGQKHNLFLLPPSGQKKTVIAGLTLIVMSGDVKLPISATLAVGSILHLEVQTI